MGWWNVDSVETGRVATTKVGESGFGEAGCLNAVPGKDPIDGVYNGDEPADIMGAALDTIADAYHLAWNRNPTLDELRAVFNFVIGPDRERGDGKYTKGDKFRVRIETQAMSSAMLVLVRENLVLGHLVDRDTTVGAFIASVLEKIGEHGPAVLQDHRSKPIPKDMRMTDAQKEFAWPFEIVLS
jgi:hypothetical protein